MIGLTRTCYYCGKERAQILKEKDFKVAICPNCEKETSSTIPDGVKEGHHVHKWIAFIGPRLVLHKCTKKSCSKTFTESFWDYAAEMKKVAKGYQTIHVQEYLDTMEKIRKGQEGLEGQEDETSVDPNLLQKYQDGLERKAIKKEERAKTKVKKVRVPKRDQHGDKI